MPGVPYSHYPRNGAEPSSKHTMAGRLPHLSGFKPSLLHPWTPTLQYALLFCISSGFEPRFFALFLLFIMYWVLFASCIPPDVTLSLILSGVRPG